MKSFLLLSIIILPHCLSAQSDPALSQQCQSAKKAFATYTPQQFQPYTDTIIHNDEHAFQFGRMTLVSPDNGEMDSIFTHGIFYPALVTGDYLPPQGASNLIGSPFPGNQITITSIKECPSIRILPKSRRYVCWIFFQGMANPVEYYFELTNDQATDDMSTPEFIQAARLTYLQKGTIII